VDSRSRHFLRLSDGAIVEVIGDELQYVVSPAVLVAVTELVHDTVGAGVPHTLRASIYSLRPSITPRVPLLYCAAHTTRVHLFTPSIYYSESPSIILSTNLDISCTSMSRPVRY